MKLKPKKAEPPRTTVTDCPQDPRFADNPALAALLTKMTSALDRRKCKTPWITNAIRAEMLCCYAKVLDDTNEAALRDFVGWLVEDGRYLAAEGNFSMFCHAYLAAELDEVPSLWEMAGDGSR